MKLSNKSLGRDELALARERRRAETFGIRLGLSGEPCGDHERYRELDEFRDHCDTPISYLKMVLNAFWNGPLAIYFICITD